MRLWNEVGLVRPPACRGRHDKPVALVASPIEPALRAHSITKMEGEPPLWSTRYADGIEWVHVGGRKWLNAQLLNWPQRRARAVAQ